MAGHREYSKRVSFASDEPGSENEPIRNLKNADRDHTAALSALRAAVRDGLESGINDKTLNDNWAETEHRYRVKYG